MPVRTSVLYGGARRRRLRPLLVLLLALGAGAAALGAWFSVSGGGGPAVVEAARAAPPSYRAGQAAPLRVRQLGLRNSHFTSPSGVIDKGNYSTAWDLAAITRYAMRNPRFRTVIRTRVKHVSWAAPTYSKIYVNKNHLLGSYPGADGVKTGWTTLAKHTLVAAARRNGVDLVAVVLGSDDSYADVHQLLDWGFRHRG